MPWCEDCAQFYESGKVSKAGECPGCGGVIAKRAGVPWHFKVLVFATAGYLAYRLYQGIVLLVHVL